VQISESSVDITIHGAFTLSSFRLVNFCTRTASVGLGFPSIRSVMADPCILPCEARTLSTSRSKAPFKRSLVCDRMRLPIASYRGDVWSFFRLRGVIARRFGMNLPPVVNAALAARLAQDSVGRLDRWSRSRFGPEGAEDSVVTHFRRCCCYQPQRSPLIPCPGAGILQLTKVLFHSSCRKRPLVL